MSLWGLPTSINFDGLSCYFSAFFFIYIALCPKLYGLLPGLSASHLHGLLCPRAAWAGRWHSVVEGVARGWAVHPMQRLPLISILLVAPQPGPIRAPPPPTPLPPLLPAFQPSSCLPSSLRPPSLISFPRPPRSRTQRRRQAAASEGRRRGGGGGSVDSGGGRRQGGRPSWGPGPAAASHRGPESVARPSPRGPVLGAPGHPTLLGLPLLPPPLPSPHPSVSPAPFSALCVFQHPILLSPSTAQPLPAPGMLFSWGLRA